MKRFLTVCSLSALALLQGQNVFAQESSPLPAIPRAAAVDNSVPGTSASTGMRTNSMSVLDDKKRLGSDDFVSFRVVEDRDGESQHLRVNDNGELEVPYICLVAASGKTCRELASIINPALEREVYSHDQMTFPVDRCR